MNHLSPFPPRQQRTVKPRGEPLAALGLLIASWIGVRAALWEEPRFELAAKPQQRQDARPVADPAPADKRPVALPRLASPATPTALPTFSAPPRPDPATDQRQSETMRDAQAHYHLLQLANQLPLTEPELNIAAPHAAILPVPALLAAPTPNGMAPPAAPALLDYLGPHMLPWIDRIFHKPVEYLGCTRQYANSNSTRSSSARLYQSVIAGRSATLRPT